MAKQGSVRLSGRFPPGARVRLVKVRDERVLRAEGGEEVDSQTVGKDGVVEFSRGVEVGGRYFAVGLIGGTHTEVRLTGREKGEESTVAAQPPVRPDRVRLSDGSFFDEPPEQHQQTPGREVGPAPGQHQVAKGVAQRSDTPRGYAHPLDPSEQAPYRRQEDVPDGVVQASHTETGRATEIVQSVQRQEDAKGLLQRSDTPHGVATPIPSGDAVQAQLVRESAAGKESRGEPVRAAAEPLGNPVKVRGAGEAGDSKRVLPGAPNDRDVVSGHDAMGQPLYTDLAATVGVKPASKPLEAMRGSKPARDRPASGEGADPLERLDDPQQDAGKSETEATTTGAGQANPSGETDVTKLTKARRGESASSSRRSAGSSGGSESTKAKE